MTQAIFLSYASQDADVARRICDALRAAGLEVWFDQSELRGGDAWDASIRKQIKECSLFVPIISSNTQEREEGYFRLEWKLAVDRSHLMADDKAFFFPVVLDDVTEPKARVPDKFRERQWSRLNDDAATKAFAARIAKLIAGSGAPSNNASNGAPTLATTQNPRHSREGGNPSFSPAADATHLHREQKNDLDSRLRGNDGVFGSASYETTPSIAVLAFANRSASADDEYFSDGLADELLNVLAKIKGLRVIARTSSFAFKGKSDDVATIGAKLNVATLLEGSVRKSGNRVRISVQLVKVADSAHLWSETYDRTLDDIFAVQDDIAQSVVKQLRATLLGEAPSSVTEVANEVAQASRARSDDPEAQRLVLQARFYREKRRPADIKRAIALCEEAIALDPQFAAAHANLAEALHAMSLYGVGFAADASTVLAYSSRARVSAEAALALDANLVAPHLLLSWLAAIVNRDRAESMREAKLALALAPNDAEAVRTLAHRLMEDGEFAESETLYARAIQLNPLWIQVRLNYSMVAHWAGQHDDALRRVKEAIAIDESSWIAQWHLVSALNSVGDYAGAAEAAAQAQALRGDHATAAVFRQRFALDGWRGYLDAVIHAPKDAIARVRVAWAEIELGRVDDAFLTLDAIVENYDQHAILLKHEPEFAPVQRDPRFAALLRRAGFTD